MTGRVFLVSLFLSSTAFAIVPGPSQQLSSGPNDAVNPAISGNWVVWTVDTGQPNGLDVFALDLPAPPAVDVTPWPGGQSFDDVDGRYAVYIDDTDVAHVKVTVAPTTTTLELGRKGNLYVNGGPHQGGMLVLIISPALKPAAK